MNKEMKVDTKFGEEEDMGIEKRLRLPAGSPLALAGRATKSGSERIIRKIDASQPRKKRVSQKRVDKGLTHFNTCNRM